MREHYHHLTTISHSIFVSFYYAADSSIIFCRYFFLLSFYFWIFFTIFETAPFRCCEKTVMNFLCARIFFIYHTHTKHHIHRLLCRYMRYVLFFCCLHLDVYASYVNEAMFFFVVVWVRKAPPQPLPSRRGCIVRISVWHNWIIDFLLLFFPDLSFIHTSDPLPAYT